MLVKYVSSISYIHLGALEMDPHNPVLLAAEQMEVKNFAQGHLADYSY